MNKMRWNKLSLLFLEGPGSSLVMKIIPTVPFSKMAKIVFIMQNSNGFWFVLNGLPKLARLFFCLEGFHHHDNIIII